MPKTIHPANSRWFWTFALVSSLVFPALNLGAQTAQPTPAPIDSLKVKVKVVEVTKTGTTISVNPVKVKLKRKEEIVVWVTNGLSTGCAACSASPASTSSRATLRLEIRSRT